MLCNTQGGWFESSVSLESCAQLCLRLPGCRGFGADRTALGACVLMNQPRWNNSNFAWTYIFDYYEATGT